MPGKRVSDKSAFGKRSFESSGQQGSHVRQKLQMKLALSKVLENVLKIALARSGARDSDSLLRNNF
jgi:hypothetical protein